MNKFVSEVKNDEVTWRLTTQQQSELKYGGGFRDINGLFLKLLIQTAFQNNQNKL